MSQPTAPEIQNISANLASVRQKIENAARASGRSPESVRLIAVSKTFPASLVRAAALAGQRDFGENRVQEATVKRREYESLYPDDPMPESLNWHLIGHLQTNKARDALDFSLIHSVDSLRLVEALGRRAEDQAKTIRVLFEIHLSDEPTKSGFAEGEIEGAIEAALARRNLRVDGLMVIAPLDAPGEQARPYFRRLFEIREKLQAAYSELALSELSMGMSGDYVPAIEEGATLVRVGRAIFGERG